MTAHAQCEISVCHLYFTAWLVPSSFRPVEVNLQSVFPKYSVTFCIATIVWQRNKMLSALLFICVSFHTVNAAHFDTYSQAAISS